MRELGASWRESIEEIPLSGLLLMLRQEQAKRVENVMTLSDKELIERLEARKTNENGGKINGN